ncbi:HET-domain-containing protein [Lepidopterella palustris CBS 459.81]|uniref:HET-domain-containing protein n=1 Tax=Lepidopterella palustris CBS 459.81 TaxID=1314670 RepID=A0A8E2DX63_9PEZI|nr:HET-domain-containing protein [Lepidopterella palustris CBS 459.81]
MYAILWVAAVLLFCHLHDTFDRRNYCRSKSGTCPSSATSDAADYFKELKRNWSDQVAVYPVETGRAGNTLWVPREFKAEYAPITHPKEIRLLYVTCEGPDKRFKSRFIHTSYDNVSTPYIAISYTWGTNIAVASTIPQGENQYIDLTESASRVLETLLVPGETLPLWIDAICIDQNNVTEQNHQLRLMREIYSNAHQVVVSLGAPTQDSSRAMDLIPQTNVCQHTCTLSPGPDWTALRALFRLPWFTRIWVIQEVALGRRPVFVLGDRAVSWNSMASDLLLHYHHFDATKPQDHIYALLGLASPATRKLLLPDYTLDLGDVYQETAVKLLQQGNSIALLHRAGIGYPRRLRGLPSWVPEWNSTYPEMVFGASHQNAGYNAARGTNPSVVINTETGSLHLDGWLVENVYKVGSARDPIYDGIDRHSPQSLKNFANVYSWIEEAEKLAIEFYLAGHWRVKHRVPSVFSLLKRLRYITGEPLLEALAQTLLAKHVQYPTTFDFSGCYTAWRTYYKQWMRKAGRLKVKDHEWKKIMSFEENFVAATLDRAFFVTDNGRMGLGSPNMQESDVVAIFKGGRTPFILRRNVGCNGLCRNFTLVGEVYVQGLMHGEWMQTGKEATVETIEIT